MSVRAGDLSAAARSLVIACAYFFDPASARPSLSRTSASLFFSASVLGGLSGAAAGFALACAVAAEGEGSVYEFLHLAQVIVMEPSEAGVCHTLTAPEPQYRHILIVSPKTCLHHLSLS